jgi:hypothetical protein
MLSNKIHLPSGLNRGGKMAFKTFFMAQDPAYFNRQGAKDAKIKDKG